MRRGVHVFESSVWLSLWLAKKMLLPGVSRFALPWFSTGGWCAGLLTSLILSASSFVGSLPDAYSALTALRYTLLSLLSTIECKTLNSKV